LCGDKRWKLERQIGHRHSCWQTKTVNQEKLGHETVDNFCWEAVYRLFTPTILQHRVAILFLQPPYGQSLTTVFMKWQVNLEIYIYRFCSLLHWKKHFNCYSIIFMLSIHVGVFQLMCCSTLMSSSVKILEKVKRNEKA